MMRGAGRLSPRLRRSDLGVRECARSHRCRPPRRPARVPGARWKWRRTGFREKALCRTTGRHARALRRVDQRLILPPPSQRIGTPGILKTRRDGYDGKGQWRIAGEGCDRVRLPGVPASMKAGPLRGRILGHPGARQKTVKCGSGIRPHNTHEGGMLAQLDPARPAAWSTGHRWTEARALAGKVADALGYVGVLTLEFFATGKARCSTRWPPGAQFGPLDHRGRGHQPVRKPHPRHLRPAAGRYGDPALPASTCAT
jgi:hypothetical protein